MARVAAMLALALGCAPATCAPGLVCAADETCVLPIDDCVVNLTGGACTGGDCTTEGGRPGCRTPYFDGACVETPPVCAAEPTCDCLDRTVRDATGLRCVYVDPHGAVVATP